ncbi:E1b 55K protein [Simian adenovirus A1285]|uniref:E1B 55 kDa protein n=1 Tax=Simian adenovirus A1285 TaxID=1159190 RepID=H9AAK6_9ADEN|nr:E1b 55K protein [Simian adenovirus A1285]
MERPDPAVPGVHPGLHQLAAVEVLAAPAGLQLLAGAASARAGVGGGGAFGGIQAGGEPGGAGGGEGGNAAVRPGPSGGGELGSTFQQQQVAEGQVGVKPKRAKNEEEHSEEALSRLTLSLINRQRPETVFYYELEHEFQHGDMHLQCKFGFEQLKTHWLEPWEDMATVCNQYVKVALRPDRVYKVSSTVHLSKCVYVIGNGATVEVEGNDRVAFNCTMQRMGPGVMGLSGVTFENVRLVCRDFHGVMFACTTELNLHGVYFFDVNHACVECWGQLRARGCTFHQCFKGVVGRAKSRVSIKKCVFERCLLGVCVEGHGRLRNNAASENICFALIKGTAVLKSNMICGAGDNRGGKHLLTCANGWCHCLRSVHVVSHPRRPWPLFESNMLMRCTLHLGARRGMFMPHQCNFSHTSVLLEPEAFTRVCFNAVFDVSMEVFKIVRYDETRARSRLCECGANHLRNVPLTLNVTEELRADHVMLPSNRTDYATSDEECG